MLDARSVRENPDAVRDAMSARNSSWDVDVFLALDAERRTLIGETEALQAERNATSKEVGQLMREGRAEDAEGRKARVREINEHLEGLEVQVQRVDEEARYLLMTAPNLPDASVPHGADETENVEVRRWGTPRDFGFEPKPHWDLGPELGILDFERGVKLAESRFVLLGRDGARLNRALINFMLDTHGRRRLHGVGAARPRECRDPHRHRPAPQVRRRPLPDH